MTDEFSTSRQNPDSDADPQDKPLSEPIERSKIPNWTKIWEKLLHVGLGEITLRIGTGMVSLALVLMVIWVMGSFYIKGQQSGQGSSFSAIAAAPTNTPQIPVPYFDIPDVSVYPAGITRAAEMHTDQPAKPRQQIEKYTVVEGDTIFGIASRFNLKPETILWGNYYTLADDPHRLSPGQELNILPVNGVYYEWHAGDGLNGVSQFYGVRPEDIINYSGNGLNAETIGDYANPNIPPGTWLVIPGGRREFITWSAPRITRSDPAVAKIFGPGACGTVMDGPVGNGTFIWPTTAKFLSGYDYSPETNHFGIDIGGNLGNAIYASDAGVVVYAGWNDWGYGNVVVIDHGNTWQSLYAHLSAYNVECGSYVYQGDVIAAMGSTGNSSGPHLHFELRTDNYKANPWDYLIK